MWDDDDKSPTANPIDHKLLFTISLPSSVILTAITNLIQNNGRDIDGRTWQGNEKQCIKL